MQNKLKKFNCPVGITLNIIGGKYKPLILWYLYKEKVMRYSELQKVLTGVTAKMLIQQLRELEEDKMIKRKIYPVVPPKVEYSLTETGKSIMPVMFEMQKWGENYIQNGN